MTYQWSDEQSISGSKQFSLYASRPEPPYASVMFDIKEDMSDAEWGTQGLADLAGVVKDALEAEGWTISNVRRVATSNWNLEQTPPE